MSSGQLGAVAQTFLRQRYRRVPDLLRLLVKRPALLTAVGAFETALLANNRTDARLKALGELKASSLVGCPF
jgi:hypothetical protein